MADYHVGCGAFAIYAGTLNKGGKLWRTKSEVTEEAINAVAQFLLEQEENVEFQYHNSRYRLAVTKIKNKENND
jgi:hypothetical protein